MPSLMRYLSWVSIVGAILILGAAPRLQGQALPTEFPLKKCDDSKQLVGYLRGQGLVTYLLATDGKADTASVQVLRAAGVSVAGFRSAVVRQLSACRLDLGRHKPATPVRVQQQILFDSARAQLRPAQPVLDSAATSAQDSTPAPIPLAPLEFADPRLEERPRQLGCDQSLRPPSPPGGPYRSREEAQRATQAWERQNSGRIHVRAVVGPDGRMLRDSITVVSSTNPSLTTKLVDALASCRYAPGRIRGVAVPVVITTGIGIEIRSERL